MNSITRRIPHALFASIAGLSCICFAETPPAASKSTTVHRELFTAGPIEPLREMAGEVKVFMRGTDVPADTISGSLVGLDGNWVVIRVDHMNGGNGQSEFHWVPVANIRKMIQKTVHPERRVQATETRLNSSTDDTKTRDQIADRLQVELDVDFRRTPMQEAFAFISSIIKTPIEIDGDALKAGGFTKNMPQTFQGEKLTAVDAIKKILEKYQDPHKPGSTMVIVVDEERKEITVTTKGFCDQQKLTPYELFAK
jgi:hypothetical protein